mmetsp:Transcript_31805/g.48059  ORF Transcript_31805/g.48059 Transcript_31805/m.48059 type:complete len:395 (+) Transcript_31805:265-1449(+)
MAARENNTSCQVASMPMTEREGNGSSALGKRNLEDFLQERTRNEKSTLSLPMPFLNIDNCAENAVTTEGVLQLINILDLPRTRTCCRSREISLPSFTLPLLHIQQKDKWSCGYRNLQMLMSALIPQLRSDHPYHQRIPCSLRRSSVGAAVPIASLKDLQKFLEAAWKVGLDSRGAEHYGSKIVGKSDEIGAVEVNSILTFLYIDSVVVQFIRTAESREMLGPFVWSYFSKQTGCECKTEHDSATAAERLLECAKNLAKKDDADGDTVCMCPLVPLYLQWEGHSVSVIGIRKLSLEDVQYQLIVLDPAKDGGKIHRTLSGAFDLRTTLDAIVPLVFDMRQIAEKDCQIVMATKRPLTKEKINDFRERVNAVTAERQTVIKHLGIVEGTASTPTAN